MYFAGSVLALTSPKNDKTAQDYRTLPGAEPGTSGMTGVRTWLGSVFTECTRRLLSTRRATRTRHRPDTRLELQTVGKKLSWEGFEKLPLLGVNRLTISPYYTDRPSAPAYD
jgi:hypothetical protein